MQNLAAFEIQKDVFIIDLYAWVSLHKIFFIPSYDYNLSTCDLEANTIVQGSSYHKTNKLKATSEWMVSGSANEQKYYFKFLSTSKLYALLA